MTITLPFLEHVDAPAGLAGEPDDVAALRTEAREFTRTVLEPAEALLDKITDPTEVFRSPVFDSAMREAARLGYTRSNLPVEWGGPGLSTYAQMVLVEELAAGAPGLGSHVLAGGIAPSVMISTRSTEVPEYADYIHSLADEASGPRGSAWAATEPNVGSDILSLFEDGIAYQTTALETADGFVINGHKSRFVSNSFCADYLVTQVNMAGTTDMSGASVFLIPTSAPGVHIGSPLDKLGLRALNQAPIEFRDVHVPKHAQVIAPGAKFERFVISLTCRGNTAVGLQSIGVARRAFEEALEYAKNRRQGGKRLIDHQLIAHKLVTAYHRIEAAKAFSYSAVQQLQDRRLNPLTSYASRVHASTMGIEVVEQMAQVLGGYGISKDHPLERYYRDIKLLTIADGPVEKVGLLAAKYL